MRATRDLSSANAQVLTFGPFRIETGQRRVLYAGTPLRLGSRAREILFALLERAGETVKKQELIARVWPGMVVEESALRVHVAALRRAFGECGSGVRYIENVNGLGYRFIAPVERLDVAAASTASSGSALSGREQRACAEIRGRESELRSLLTMLGQRRLVSIVGPGGIGKTALALAAAAQCAPAYADGVKFIDLASTRDAAELHAAVAGALGMPLAAAEGPQVGCDNNDHRLVVLDNCEQVIEAAARVVEAIGTQAPKLHFLITSREPLCAMNDSELRLTPLGTPPTAVALTVAQALEFPAIQLFVERATQSSDQFCLTQADLPSVVAICQRLEGIPLWIELAAMRLGLIGVRGLAAYRDDLLGFLSAGRRTAPLRQQSLRATLDWSFALLSPAEQAALCQLATLDGSFDLDRARQVIAHEAIDPDDVAELVTKLASKSLAFTATAGGVYFRLPHVVRAHALERARTTTVPSRTCQCLRQGDVTLLNTSDKQENRQSTRRNVSASASDRNRLWIAHQTR